MPLSRYDVKLRTQTDTLTQNNTNHKRNDVKLNTQTDRRTQSNKKHKHPLPDMMQN